MSVRVVARIRPALEGELGKDMIVRVDRGIDGKSPSVVKVPNPKNESESFSFAFHGVYDQPTTQEELFNAEVAPHVKALFAGLDLTIFAYGATGCGKTHTMRGGLKLAERGVIPRLLSNVFRRGKKKANDSHGKTRVDVALSYYEIYNDRVFDLLEPPDKRSVMGLPLRDNKGRTIVVGLSERACKDLKDFESLYIHANTHRVTAATKLNAHSSRSHAILRVKVTQTTADQVRESYCSAIDLAGSEDNRRTANDRERLVESAAINKSLFALSQCIDAISRGEKRVPYRDSKMTRILSLGQNNCITIMILNLAPLRSYHLDTLSALNVSSRAKRIEVREIENEVVYKQISRTMSLTGTSLHRQPLRPITNVQVGVPLKAEEKDKDKHKPVKDFSVYADRARATPAMPTVTTSQMRVQPKSMSQIELSEPAGLVRPGSHGPPAGPGPTSSAQPSMSAAQIEAMVERKVAEILALRTALNPNALAVRSPATGVTYTSEGIRLRLEALERRIADGNRPDDAKAEGLRCLLQARLATETAGDDDGALRLNEQALLFPRGQRNFLGNMDMLGAKIAAKVAQSGRVALTPTRGRAPDARGGSGDEYTSHVEGGGEEEEEGVVGQKHKRTKKSALKSAKRLAENEPAGPASPITKQLLDIVNSRDPQLIRGLSGFGAKKAQDLVDQLNLQAGLHGTSFVESLAQLRMLSGMGSRTVEKAYNGLVRVAM